MNKYISGINAIFLVGHQYGRFVKSCISAYATNHYLIKFTYCYNHVVKHIGYKNKNIANTVIDFGKPPNSCFAMFARFDWKSCDGLWGFLLFLTPKKKTFVDKFIPIPAFYHRGNGYLLHIYPPFFSLYIILPNAIITIIATTVSAIPPISIFNDCHLVSCFSTG